MFANLAIICSLQACDLEPEAATTRASPFWPQRCHEIAEISTVQTAQAVKSSSVNSHFSISKKSTPLLRIQRAVPCPLLPARRTFSDSSDWFLR